MTNTNCDVCGQPNTCCGIKVCDLCEADMNVESGVASKRVAPIDLQANCGYGGLSR